ncbi:MAG: hypothetical protein Q9227_008919 [Pyrenula ochraceoflavens]
MAEQPAEQPKRIIVYCDGTGNSIYDSRQDGIFSNVARIDRCIARVTSKGTQQVGCYVPGIGTNEENPSKWRAELNGRGQSLKSSREHTDDIVLGIEERIKMAYKHICDNYLGEKDQIILIGFSRGAFVVRCVADIVCKIGLLTKKGLLYLNLVYQTWEMCGGAPYPPDETGSRNEDRVYLFSRAKNLVVQEESAKKEPDVKHPRAFDRLLENKDLLRRQIQIKVCALWDTVASIGNLERFCLSEPQPPAGLEFVDSLLLDRIENAFHALSLHERRLDFVPIVWRTSEGETKQRSSRLRQCWFVGYHSDIGGSESPESLAHISLAWMMARLQDFVDFDTNNFCYPPPQGSNWELKLDKGGKNYPSLSHFL